MQFGLVRRGRWTYSAKVLLLSGLVQSPTVILLKAGSDALESGWSERENRARQEVAVGGGGGIRLSKEMPPHYVQVKPEEKRLGAKLPGRSRHQ